MADKITNDITLLFKTKLDEKSKQEVGKNLKSLLENAAIGFDEAETKRNLEPIIRMMKKLFDKAEIAFDADQLLAMPSKQALQKMAEIEVDQLQLAFDKALAKSGGIKIDFGDMDLSATTESLKKLNNEVSRIGDRVASTTKKSVREIENTITSLSKTKKLDETVEHIEKTLEAVNDPKHYTSQKSAAKALQQARDALNKSVENNDPWEKQYQHMLKFVSRYEAMTKKVKPLIDEERPEFKSLYEQLVPKAGEMKMSLEHLIDLRQGNELREYKNQPWARETTLKQIRDSLKNGITVKEGTGGIDERHVDNPTPPWEENDNKTTKVPNTKEPLVDPVDVKGAELVIEAEEERLRLVEQRRIEEEKAAEAARKAAEEAKKKKKAETVSTPKTETEKLIYDAVKAAKGDRTDGQWENLDLDTRERLLEKSLKSSIDFSALDEDQQFDLLYDAAGYSIGAKGNNLSKIAAKYDGQIKAIEQVVELSLDEAYSNASEDIQKLVQRYAQVFDSGNDESFDLYDKIREKDSALADLIDSDDGWENLKSRLNSESGSVTPPVTESATEQTNSSLAEQTTLLEKIQKLTTYIDDEYLSAGKHLSDFLDDVQRESGELDGELKEILTTLNLIDDKGNLTFNVKRNGEEGGGTTHNGALISDDFVLIERGNYERVKNSKLPDSTQSAAKDGVNVAEVLGYLPSKHTEGFFDVQGTAKGHNLFEGGVLSQDVVNATEDQLEQLIQAFIKAIDYGFNIENGGSNIVYDKEKGFSFYDLEELSVDEADFWNSKTEAEKKLWALEELFSLFSGINRDHDGLENDDGAGVLAERIRGVVEAKNIVSFDDVDEKGRNYEDIYDDVFSRNIDDEFADILAQVDAEAEAHRENAATIVAETQAQETLNDAKVEGQRIDVKEDVSTVVDKPVATVEPAGEVAAKSSIQTEELRQLLNSITYNVKVVQDAEPAEDNKISIDEAALENVLNRITYNVKIAHDDADKTANKIAIDEGALEQTLNRVFANVLNPEVDQAESESKNEPWALEKTLLSVKEVLDGIRTNTTKAESVEIAPVNMEVDNVLATENTLAAIKTAVEAINKKVIKGTKAKTSNGGAEKKAGVGKKNTENYAGSQYFTEKLKTQTMQLAKFRAQLMTTGKLTDDVDAQIYELLDALAQVKNGPDFSQWAQKFQQLKTSVGITDIFDKAEGKEATASYQQLIEFQKTRNKLELQYEKAQDGSALKQFYSEQLTQMDNVIAKQEEMLENEEYEAKLAKIREEQARKLGEAEAKAADKAAKKTATNAKKMAQREAMLGKAGNAVGRAENTWMSAIGLEGELPAGFVADIDKYYQKLDALRKKHQELKNSDIISEEQKKELIDQTISINKMTEEIGGLISQYQRLSGDNTEVLGASTLSDKATIGEYEQALRQAVMTATNGKAQIKGFDHDTKTLTYTLKTGKHAFTEYTAEVRELDHQYTSTAGKTKKMETFLEATKRKMKELTSYFSGMAVFNRVGQELRRGIQYVREIDLALTELKKVTDETEETYDKFLDTAAKTGARLGTTISAVTEATATFAKLGYSMEQATEMAEAAIVYKNVGDNIESTGDAADSIISTMKGFRLEASESMAIVDRFNEVGNRFAITSQGIGEALRLSASALSEGGNSLDESIGLITAANEVVRFMPRSHSNMVTRSDLKRGNS